MRVLNFPKQQVSPTIDEDGLVVSGESKRGGHQVATFKACKRKGAFKYRYKVPRITCPPLDGKVPAWQLGNLVHQGIANWLAGTMVCDKAASYQRAITTRSIREGSTNAYEQAAELTHKYMNYVAEEKPAWVCLAIEPEIECDFGHGMGVFTVGADAIYWDRAKKEPVIVDWKTAGRTKTRYDYAYTEQYMNYRMVLREVARANGKPDDWGQVIVGVIPTGKTNFLKRDLIECAYFPAAQRDHRGNLEDSLFDLTAADELPREHLVTKPTIGPACQGMYAPCDYRDTHCFIGGILK